MKPHIPSIENLHVIPEEMVILCASQFGPTEENGFVNSIKMANEYKLAGLTPIYLCDNNMKDIYVTSIEKLKKLYH